MISELSGSNKVVGAKQAKRALRDGRAARLYMAMDADPRLLQPLVLRHRRGGRRGGFAEMSRLLL